MIGERAAQLRKALKLTQREVADQIGVTPDTISRIERGVHTPDHKHVVDLARVLNVTPDYLNGLVDTPQESRALSDREWEIIKMIRSGDPIIQQAIDLAFLIQQEQQRREVLKGNTVKH